MDYATYKQFRSELLKDRDLLRLDCMNPVQALASWAGTAPQHTATASTDQAIDAWSKASGLKLVPERTVVGRGVRDLLGATFSGALESREELWLPEDVYPVYWELARQAAVTARPFSTLPQPNWNFLARTSNRAAIVLPVPLSPLGRLPDEIEANAIFRWLARSPQRLLIIDAVYTFDFNASRGLIDSLLAQYEDQCVALWSCSKSWVSPRSFGIAAVPRGLAPALRSRVSPPSQADLDKIHATLKEHPNLFRLQQEAFTREWQRLAPHIRKAASDWQPPASGYFSVVSAPFETLLDKHGILSVPVSVFGAPHDELSIVTCLHDLAEHEKESRVS